MFRRAVVAFVAGWLVLACGDETTINNYSVTSSGIIVGYVNPIEEFTIVRLDSLPFVRIDPTGKFIFTEVPSGDHVISIEPITFSDRRLSGITVWPSQLVMLGTIELSTLPYPVYDTYPADEDSLVPTSKNYGIQLYADEPLDTADLNAHTVIVPSIEGRWQGKGNSDQGPAVYSFYPDKLDTAGTFQRYLPGRIFSIGTSYEVRIDGAVKTALGVPLGREIVFNFSTEPLGVDVFIPADGLENGVRLTSFVPQISFNDSISIDSLSRAVSFSPTINGIWVDRSKGSEFVFLPSDGALPPATTFTMVVSGDVSLAGAAHLVAPDTTRFTTEPVGVTRTIPCDGCTGYSSVSVEFNITMNRSSVESAISVTSSAGEIIAGNFYWNAINRTDRYVSFNPKAPLDPGGLYKLTVSTGALSSDGHPIYKEVIVHFLAN